MNILYISGIFSWQTKIITGIIGKWVVRKLVKNENVNLVNFLGSNSQ